MSDTTMILKAAAFAAHKHKDQRRKDADASPYINHPLELARVLAEVGGVTDSATLCAALLHDTIEDTATTYDELAQHFGEEVANIVDEVSDDKTLPKRIGQVQAVRVHQISNEGSVRSRSEEDEVRAHDAVLIA
jgi:(p)ppGpp synthase/HD superfamily hydrolase